MQSITPKSMSRRLIGAFLSTIPAAVVTTMVMAFTVGWAPGAHAAQDAVICPADRINSNGNICTASDVQLAAASVGAGSEGGVCTPGEPVQVAVAGTVSLRKGDRFDIGIWVSTDGKPIELRGGTNGAPDEGGAQTCEVLPLPYMPISIANGISPVINSFDDANPVQDCYDTSANNNGDTSEGFLLTEPRDNVVNGRVDVNADGVINSDDTVISPTYPVLGAYVQSGVLDLDLDGVAGEINGDDSGIWSGRAVQNGLIDYNNDGQFGQASDTAVQEFNDLLTVTCQAGPSASGGLLLDSLVTWNVPSDGDNVCNPTNPSSYSASFNSSKCSVSSSEIDIQIVGKVTIVKQATANPSLDFNFAYTNDQPTNVDIDGNPLTDISAQSPFTLKDGESAVIYGVIGTRIIDGGDFIPANIVVSETSLPAGWEINDIVCTGDDTTPVVVDTVAGTATIELSYNAADYTLSQDDVTCTFVNAEAPATLTVVKNTNGGNGTFDVEWGDQNGAGTPALSAITTTGGTGSDTVAITTNLGSNTFYVEETLTAQQIADGWTFESVSCANQDGPLSGTPYDIDPGRHGIGGLTFNAGDDITCTFVNNAAAQLTVTKVAQGGDDSFPFVTNLPAPWDTFNLNTSGGGANTGPIIVPIPDAAAGVDVSVVEQLVADWNLAGIACSGTTETVNGNGVDFTLLPGNVVNCTFTNTADGQVTIIKNTIGGDGNFQFTTDVPGATSPFNIQTSNNTGSVSIATPPPGTYIVTETVPTGWDLTAMSCLETGGNSISNSGPTGPSTITLIIEAGETVTCTFTNTQRGQIVIAKTTDPASNDVFGFTSTSGTATPIPASFTAAPGVPAVFNNGGANLLPGTYSVTEDDPTPGYDLTDIVCQEQVVVGPTPSTVDVGTRTATINLDPGEVVFCTFANAKRANLTIQKVVSADGPLDNTFDFTSTSLPSVSFSLGPVVAGVPVSTDFNNLVPGSYDVAEDVADALANGWALVDSSCSDGSTVDNIDLAPGEDVTCTFTNSPLGSATIVKNTIGGDDTFDYVGTAPFDGLQLTTVAGTAQQDYGFQLDPANNPYGIQEDPLPVGWSLTGLGCLEDGDQDSSVDLANRSATINAQFGEQITCTFTNTLDGTITIRKETLPDGVDQTFTFGGDLAGSIRDFSVFGEEIVDSLQPGTYSSTETVPAGWQITGISCDDSQAPNSTFTFTNSITPGGTDAYEAGDDTVNVTLAAGENVICSFENTQESSITIVKSVVGTGGTFNFGSAALGPFSLNPADNASDQANFTNLLPIQGGYLVAETPVPAGYQLTDIACSGGGDVLIGSDDVFNPGDTGVTINLAPGEDVICTFQNTQLGSITVAKLTLPTGSPDSFTFTGDVGGSLTDGQSATPVAVLPGTYSSTETVLAGWDLANIDCDDDASSTPSTGDLNTATATFNVEPGENVVCAFTNVQRATVVVRKIVVRDDGGNATIGEFGITSTAGTLNFDGGPTVGDVTTYTATVTGVVPNTGYSVSETPLTGYTPSNWSCDDDTGSVLENGGDPTGALFTVGPGKTVTCTITNDDIAPTLTLIKNVVNDNFGTAGPDDFGISVGGTPVTSGASNPYTANTPLAIDEVGLAGYSFVSITGDPECPAALGGDVVLSEGENITCTITNDDDPPDINLAKTVNGPATLEANGTYTVVYTVTASNAGTGNGEYNLTDTFSPAAGVTFNSATLAYVAGSENAQTGALTPPPLANGGTWVTAEQLGAGLNESWTITANFTVDPAVITDNGRICDPNGAANAGFYNYVEGVTNETDLTDNDACTNVPAPSVNLSKAVNGPATLEANGTYTVVYTVTASNGGSGPGIYDLTDTFSPAAGVTFNSATLAYMAGTEDDQSGALTTPPLANGGTWVTGEALGGGLTEMWVITANFTVDPAVLADGDRACDPEAAQNSGFYNYVEGVVNEADLSDNDACTDVPTPDINLAKTVNGPATREANGTYTVVYTVTATNNGAGPGVYDLTDTFSPAAGVTFNSATLAYVAGSENSQTGALTAPPLANGGTWVTGEALVSGRNESWTISANFTVDPATLIPNEAQCDPANPAINTGFYNAVSGVVNETNVDDNDTCTDVPTPALNLAKTVNGPATLEANGTYTVVYTVTATNGGEGAGVYDLADTFSPAAGVTFNSATLAYVAGSENSQTGTLTAPPLANGGTWVTGESLAGGQNESWTITANFTVDPAVVDPATQTCDPANPAINTGFYNAVSGIDNESNVDDNDTCTDVDIPQLTLMKSLIGGGPAAPGDFLLTLTGADNVHGTGVDYVSGDMPVVSAGVQYTLSETPDQVANYYAAGISCTNDNTGANVPHPVTLGTTDSVTCYQANAYRPPIPPTPDVPVPVDNKWALALLALLMLSMGLYLGPRMIQRR